MIENNIFMATIVNEVNRLSVSRVYQQEWEKEQANYLGLSIVIETLQLL